MQTGDEHIDFDLLTKYLVGECTEAETAAVQVWLADSADNRAVLDELRQVLDATDDVQPTADVDTDAAWAKMQQKMQVPNEPKVVQMPQQGARPFKMWRAVAVAAIFFGAIAMIKQVYKFFPADNTPFAEVSTTLETRIDTLPDGSIVTLNQHSAISYPEQFAGNERHVSLTGEAFFQVAKDSTKPFIIDVGEVDVTVLGTSFNINAYGANEDIQVIVETGKVKVTDKKNASVLLLPGDEATFNKAKGQLQKLPADDIDYQFWRLKKLVFTNTTLTEVLKILNDKYQANLSLADQASGTCRFTATFEDDSLDTILNVLTATFNLQLETANDQRILKGKACGGPEM